jgi:hypothetical protein
MHDGTGDEHCVFQNQVIASADEKTSFAHRWTCHPGWRLFPVHWLDFVYALNGAYFDAMHKVRAFLRA